MAVLARRSSVMVSASAASLGGAGSASAPPGPPASTLSAVASSRLVAVIVDAARGSGIGGIGRGLAPPEGCRERQGERRSSRDAEHVHGLPRRAEDG